MLYHIDVTDEEYLPYNYDLLFHYVLSYGVSCISNRNCLPGNAERGRGCALPSIKPFGYRSNRALLQMYPYAFPMWQLMCLLCKIRLIRFCSFNLRRGAPLPKIRIHQDIHWRLFIRALGNLGREGSPLGRDI